MERMTIAEWVAADAPGTLILRRNRGIGRHKTFVVKRSTYGGAVVSGYTMTCFDEQRPADRDHVETPEQIAQRLGGTVQVQGDVVTQG